MKASKPRAAAATRASPPGRSHVAVSTQEPSADSGSARSPPSARSSAQSLWWSDATTTAAAFNTERGAKRPGA